jgi:predicted nucleotidyltransferase
MKVYEKREDLKRVAIETFAAQAEVYQIRLFGREAQGKSDHYSDIDMIICSNDPARTQAKYKDLFSSISPVRATLTLNATSDGFSEMVMLEDYSPYHKIDFSIGDFGKEDWPFIVVYDSHEKPRARQTQLQAANIRQDVAYKLTDVLFSVARFTKCLFRWDVDMYRRWKSLTDVTLVLLYERHFGWERETLKQKLGPYEFKSLYENLDHAERTHLHAIYPPDAKLNLAFSYQASFELFITLSRQKAMHFEVGLDDRFIAYIKSFVDMEISRFHRQGSEK